MTNTLQFNKEEHGQLIANPIEYGIGGSDDHWWAYTICQLTNEQGYLDRNGNVVAPLIDGIDGLFGEWLPSENAAKDACMKHFESLLKRLKYDQFVELAKDVLERLEAR